MSDGSSGSSESISTTQGSRTDVVSDKTTTTTTTSCGSHIEKFCESCPTSIGSHGSYDGHLFLLKDGEFLFDKTGSTQSSLTLATHIHMMSVSSVFKTIFNLTQLNQKDAVRCYSSFYLHPDLNRYGDIPCIEDTRVKIKHPTEDHDYIHANFVDGYKEKKKYILAQAPFAHQREHYWKMVWESKAVMVVSMMHDLKTEPAFCLIPTQSGGTEVFDQFKIVNCGTRNIRNTYDATVIKIDHGKEKRNLLFITFYDWHEKGAPHRPDEVLKFIVDMNHNRELLIEKAKKDEWLKKKGPIVLHCLAGTGRTSAVVAIDICCRKMDDTKDFRSGQLLDVDDTITRIRSQRACAVEKGEQMMLINFAVLEYAIRMRYVGDRLLSELDLEHFKQKQFSERARD